MSKPAKIELYKQAIDIAVQKPYDECIKSLKNFCSSKFLELEKHENTISSNSDKLSKSALKFVIEQYSVFSRESIHMLVDAMLRNYDWPELFKELQENINEERGKFTNDVPHLEIMRRGYKQDLNIDTDNVSHCCATSAFIKKMKNIFNNNDNAYSAGALLAFEGHAIAEFWNIDDIINSYNGKDKLDNNTLTKIYILGHKDFEIGHEEHLKQAISHYITKNNIRNLCLGYMMVSLTMNTWWQQLYIECQRIDIEEVFKPENIEEFDINTRFKK